jgi:hypothetical protein
MRDQEKGDQLLYSSVARRGQVPMRELSTAYPLSSTRERKGYKIYILHATAGEGKAGQGGDKVEEPKARRGMNERPKSEEEVKRR